MENQLFIKRYFLYVLCLFCLVTQLAAQDSTVKRKTIEITSTFKPVLRDASKINFNAAPPAVDTSRPRLSYSIPAQYLFLTYQPATLKPVALSTDTSSVWQNDNYLKVGIGNIHQPFIQTGFSFGDQKHTAFNIFANEYNSKGNLSYQKNSMTEVALVGRVINQNKTQWDGRIGFKSDGYFLYGYQPDTLKFTKDQLQQRFQTFSGSLGFRNTEPTEFGLTYNPNVHIAVFNDNHNPKATEANTVLNLPLQKAITKSFAFNLGFTADLSTYTLQGHQSNQNNLYYVSPALLFKTPNFYLLAQVTPSWDNKAFTLLPDFMADITTSDQRFTIQLGWIGYYDKGTYQRLASVNPWLAQPGSLLNTRIQERYAGFKGSLSDHFTYSAKVGYQEYRNMPLFVNDSVDGKTFLIRYESDMEDLQFHGELAYTVGEDLSITAAVNYNQYTKLKNELKAWGLLPLELRSSVRWQLMKDLWIKGDLWAFEGAQFRGNNGQAYKGTGAFDMNVGIEFRIARQLNLWFQMNNLFNNQYQRWHQYESYGFNILGGVIFSFGQK